MTKLTSAFTKKEREALQKYCEVVLHDDKEYTSDEILEIYEIVCDTFPYAYDDDGYPRELGWLFEHIIDKLVDL